MKWNRFLLLVFLSALTAGCWDQRVVDATRQAADRQADQNKIVGRLVEENLKSRRDVLGIHRDLQSERKNLNGQLAALEAERKKITADRRTQSMLVAMSRGFGLLFLAILTVGFASLALFGLRSEQAETGEVLDLMVRQVVPSVGLLDRPVPSPRQLTDTEKGGRIR